MGQPKKFGSPLYCACWPVVGYPVVAGGGGKKSSGIANRVLALEQQGEELSDEPVSTLLTNDAGLRMVVASGGSRLIVALGVGGLMALSLNKDERQQPVFSAITGQLAAALLQFGHVKSLAYGNASSLLAVGWEDRSLQIMEWPSLKIKFHIRDEHGLRDVVRDMDFSTGHKDKVLVTTCEDGTCSLWQAETGEHITSLSMPAGLPRGSGFTLARFAKSTPVVLYTSVVGQGNGFMLRWEQDVDGNMLLTKRNQLHKDPITAIEVSCTGRFLGTGTSEGDIGIFSGLKLTPLRRVRQAHMVFVTALAFAPDESALLTASADASARLTLVKTMSRLPLQGARQRLTFTFATILVLLLAYVVQWWLQRVRRQ